MLRRFFQRMIEARQEKANREIARLMRREYPYETEDYIYDNIVNPHTSEK